MQGYSAAFARIYNQHWARFAQTTAPVLRAFYETTKTGDQNRTLLDICCGTGQLALHFLDAGYDVTGIDLSEPMLEFARTNTAPYIVAGRAQFYLADASNFSLDSQYGLALSTFDALNHLPELASLKGCFQSVFSALVEGGFFIFDLNTPTGLRNWNNFSLDDQPEMMLVTRAVYDAAGGKAYTRISGFTRREDGLYDRFEETAVETAFDLEAVRSALEEAGFCGVRLARLADLAVAAESPENEARIFFIAEKARPAYPNA